MIQSLKLVSYRGFSDITIEFSNITCFVGENSTGKSTIIQAINDLLKTDNPIPQTYFKVGGNDINATSLLLTLQDGKQVFKNIKEGTRENPNSLPECLSLIEPIHSSCSISLKENKASTPIKDCKINDKAWQNILSQCDFTLETANILDIITV